MTVLPRKGRYTSDEIQGNLGLGPTSQVLAKVSDGQLGIGVRKPRQGCVVQRERLASYSGSKSG